MRIEIGKCIDGWADVLVRRSRRSGLPATLIRGVRKGGAKAAVQAELERESLERLTPSAQE